MLFVYLILCVAVAWVGRNRILRFWGNFLLSIIITPLIVALILLIGAPARKKEETTAPAKTVAG